MIYLALVFSLFFICILILLYVFKVNVKSQEKKISDTFKSLSYDMMEKNNRSFFELASTYFDKHREGAKEDLKEKQKEIESILNPIKQTLKELEEHTKEIENKRLSSYSSLTKQVDSLQETQIALQGETSNLVKALKSPNIRGAWGQIHLRRVVELSGMLNNCDFFEQKSFSDDDKTYRPDLIVKLPGDRQIIVDAKTPIDAYLESIDEKDEIRKKEKLHSHAKHIRKHIRDLSSKQYWKNVDLSPEYVVLFLPAEAFFSAALEQDPTLIEVGMKDNVIIATPTTLDRKSVV